MLALPYLDTVITQFIVLLLQTVTCKQFKESWRYPQSRSQSKTDVERMPFGLQLNVVQGQKLWPT